LNKGKKQRAKKGQKTSKILYVLRQLLSLSAIISGIDKDSNKIETALTGAIFSALNKKKL